MRIYIEHCFEMRSGSFDLIKAPDSASNAVIRGTCWPCNFNLSQGWPMLSFVGPHGNLRSSTSVSPLGDVGVRSGTGFTNAVRISLWMMSYKVTARGKECGSVALSRSCIKTRLGCVATASHSFDGLSYAGVRQVFLLFKALTQEGCQDSKLVRPLWL